MLLSIIDVKSFAERLDSEQSRLELSFCRHRPTAPRLEQYVFVMGSSRKL
jgi:hypothetical protein